MPFGAKNIDDAAERIDINTKDPHSWGMPKDVPGRETGHPETTDDVNNRRDSGPTDHPEPSSRTQEYADSVSSYAEGGAIPDGDADEQGGISDDDEDDSPSNQFNVNDALQTIDQIMQHGYAKMGLGQQQPQQPQGAIPDQSDQQAQSFDDGGPVPDANGNDDQPQQPQAPDQTQGAIPEQPGLLQRAGNVLKTLAPPAPGGQQGLKYIASMLQGIGAMPIPAAQHIEHQTGQSDPNMAKLQAAHELATTQGPDAAWSYLQSLRKQYDFNRTNAAVKANQGNLNQSTEAATQAMTNILDGTKTHFSPLPNGQGVKVTVHKVGG